MKILKPLPIPTPEELAHIEQIRSIERAELVAQVRASAVSAQPRPLLFLDFDDVICLSSPYGGYDVFAPDPPEDLYEKLWHPPAIQALLAILDEHRPAVVVTTSWLRLMDRAGFEELFRHTGLHAVADSLHPAWEAPPGTGTRLDAIERWLAVHHAGEPLVVLDDPRSGTGLQESWLDRAGCVVLCAENVGLHDGHLPAVRAALTDDFGPITDEQFEVLRKASPKVRGRTLSTLLGDKNGT